MEKLIYLLAICISASLFSCDSRGCQLDVEEQNAIKEDIGVLSDTLKYHLIKQDSISAELLNKVDSLTIALNAAKEDLVVSQNRIDKLGGPKRIWNCLTAGALLLSIIAMILALSLYNIVCGIKHEQKKLNNEVKRIHSDAPQQQQQPQRTKLVENQIEKTLRSIGRRVDSLEKQIMDKENSGTPEQKNPPKTLKKGYARINSEEYFLGVSSCEEETSVYEIDFKDDDNGEFSIISLKKLQSRDDWNDAVVCSGCLLDDAHNFDVEEKGKCVRTGSNDWKITSKLKIKVS